MSATRTIIIVGAATAVVWTGVAGAQIARAGAAPASRSDSRPAAIAVPVQPTDAERRALLSTRLGAMLKDGRGGRLADPKPVAVSQGRQPRPVAPASRATRLAAARSAPEPASSIAPPAYRASAVRTSFGSGYTPPRLDLTTPPLVPSDPIECLTQAIYYEARNESEDGQAAVAEVVLNRAGSGLYPRDVCQVVYQRNARTCQFTFTCDGAIGRSAINANAWARAERIARSVYRGETKSLLPTTSVNYHASYVKPTWSTRLEQVRRIGAHIFYGAPRNGSNPGAVERPRPAPPTGLVFVKNEAIERAYAALMGRDEPAKPAG